MNELTFNSFKNDFDAICNQVNDKKEAVTLTLKSNRKVYILPEENYDCMQQFVISKITFKNLASQA